MENQVDVGNLLHQGVCGVQSTGLSVAELGRSIALVLLIMQQGNNIIKELLENYNLPSVLVNVSNNQLLREQVRGLEGMLPIYTYLSHVSKDNHTLLRLFTNAGIGLESVHFAPHISSCTLQLVAHLVRIPAMVTRVCSSSDSKQN